ncbi:MAG: 2'-5' RNA ligase family protein [Chloroflexia bacterium]
MQEYHPTGETAIIIVPPRDVCGYADHYRQLYMPDMVRNIEPHFTLVYPFAPYDLLGEVEPRLAEALAACPPRRLSIRGFAVFRESGVLYLRIADPERVLSLYRAIQAAFPEYPAYGGEFGEQLTPHLTVGRFSDPDELEKVYSELAVQRLYIGFDVESVVLKYKNDDGIWDTWSEVPLLGAG